MASPGGNNPLTFRFNLDNNATTIAHTLAALEDAHWTSLVLSEPALLFLQDVDYRFSELDRQIQLLASAPWVKIKSSDHGHGRSKNLVRTVDSIPDLTDLRAFLDAQPLSRPSMMGDLTWQIATYIAESVKATIDAIERRDYDSLVSIFRPPVPGEVVSPRDWIVGTSPVQLAQMVLQQMRADLTPQITRIVTGSILITMISSGGPILVGFGGLLTARSLIKKTRSEAQKAAAETVKSRAEANFLDAQSFKVIAEAEKVRAETAELNINMIKAVIAHGEPLDAQASRAINDVLLQLAVRVNPLADTVFRSTAERLLIQNQSSIAFLARYLEEVDDAD